MSRMMWVIVGLVAVIVILLLYIWLAKPTLVLPTVTVALPQASMDAIKQQTKLNDIQLRVRSDGKAYVLGDGKQLAQVDYTPETLSNTLRIAGKVAAPPPPYMTALSALPGVFPNLTTNALLTGLAAYYFLPLETTIRFTSG